MSSRSDRRKEVKKLFAKLSGSETRGDWEAWQDVWAEDSIFEQLDPAGNIQKRKAYREMCDDMLKEVAPGVTLFQSLESKQNRYFGWEIKKSPDGAHGTFQYVATKDRKVLIGGEAKFHVSILDGVTKLKFLSWQPQLFSEEAERHLVRGESRLNLSASVREIFPTDLKFGKRLGKGSFGVVHLGSFRGSPVAIKSIDQLAGVSDADPLVTTFLDEAVLTCTLPPHPNVIQTYGVCLSPTPCLVMEYLENGSLLETLMSRKVPLSEKLRYIRQIIAGMIHLHAEGIVHRDLAARNVLVGARDVKISDFGLSRLVDANGYATAEGVLGSVQWMAPESIERRRFSTASDVWMFGCLLLEIFNDGAPPFPNKSAHQVINLVVNKRRRPHISNRTVPPDYRVSIRHCLKRHKDERPPFEKLAISFSAEEVPNSPRLRTGPQTVSQYV